MTPKGKRKNWWAVRFSTAGSFPEQLTLLLQDFLLVSFMLVAAGGLDWLLRFATFANLAKRIIEALLLCVTVVVVGLFGSELAGLCFFTVARAIARERDNFRREMRRRATVLPIPNEAPAPIHLPEDLDSNRALNSLRLENAKQIQALRTEIESGRFTRDVAEMPKSFETLSGAHRRFDAVSFCEVAFWHTDGDAFAEEYFSRCSALAGQGKVVNRLFVIGRDEFEQGEDLIYKVLFRHIRCGIGVAIVPYDELPPRLRALDLDFGLWDLGSAYSRFRQHGDWNRALYMEFSISGQNTGVAEKLELYKEMLPYIWLADEKFLSSHAELMREVWECCCRNSQHIARRAGQPVSTERIPYLTVCVEGDLKSVVKNFFNVWRITRVSVVDEPPASRTPNSAIDDPHARRPRC